MWQPLRPPYVLKSGAHYFAKLTLSSFEKMVANKGILADKFQEANFKDIQIYDTRNELGPHAPPDTGTEGPWAEGTYAGPSQQVDLPSQVTKVWVLG
jgi:hypothetical protein